MVGVPLPLVMHLVPSVDQAFPVTIHLVSPDPHQHQNIIPLQHNRAVYWIHECTEEVFKSQCFPKDLLHPREDHLLQRFSLHACLEEHYLVPLQVHHLWSQPPELPDHSLHCQFPHLSYSGRLKCIRDHPQGVTFAHTNCWVWWMFFLTVEMICNYFVKIWKDYAENTRDNVVNGRSRSENVQICPELCNKSDPEGKKWKTAKLRKVHFAQKWATSDNWKQFSLTSEDVLEYPDVFCKSSFFVNSNIAETSVPGSSPLGDDL